MIELTLLATLLTEHNASHWEMSCAEWNQNRIEILSDRNLNSDAHEYLIDYLRTKVSIIVMFISSDAKISLLDSERVRSSLCTKFFSV